ncbi:MAG: type II secretion system F family protein [Pontibacterium sp.]
MAQFVYEGRNPDGKKVTGRVDAEGRSQAASQLLADGITPVQIEVAPQAKKESDMPSGHIRLRFLEKVTIDELIMFSRQMYSLTKAGVPLTRSMRGLAGSLRNPLLQESVNSLSDDLDKGNTLSSAMRKHPKIFTDLYISIIHVGENTGRLDEAFAQMAAYLELERNTVKNVKQATRYPMFVIFAIGVAMTIINIFVIPAFKSVFASLGGAVPWQTKVLIGVSDFMVDWWYLLLALLVLSVVVFRRWVSSDAGEVNWDRIKLKFPLVGNIFYRVILGRFTRTFSIILKAGVPIEQGLVVVSRAVGNRYIGEKIAGMRKGIERGESFSQAAARTEMFSPLVMQMLAVGEETGQVDHMLAEAADFYEEEVNYDLKNLATAIEPILIIAIGGMVLVLALGVFLPLWELSTAMNG